MLALETVMEVRRLLDADELSQRKIALKLGVSRGIVNAIANGRRSLHGRERAASKGTFPYQDSTPERCRGCGAMVYMPCLLCRARYYRSRQQEELHQASHGATRQPRVA